MLYYLRDTELSSEETEAALARNLNLAFLIRFVGPDHHQYQEALELFQRWKSHPQWAHVVQFYEHGLEQILPELEHAYRHAPQFAQRWDHLNRYVKELLASNLTASEQGADPPDIPSLDDFQEAVWGVFFPEASGLPENWDRHVEALREKRTVRLQAFNPSPIQDPTQQILFTSNALLTLPSTSQSVEEWHCSEAMRTKLTAISQEAQEYWYDHPIPLGVPPENNEILYGLQGLNEAVAFEQKLSKIQQKPITCVLSVSVTHSGLQTLAKQYLQEVLAQANPLPYVRVVAFTEADTQRIVQEVLLPAVQHYLPTDSAETLLQVWGIDGEYGRHYSFLKAITTFWKILVDSNIEGTFKIDLDQVFPQQALVEQTQQSAFEHLKTPLWGAIGRDWQNRPVELGLIAGAIVNERDIHQGVFTPDVVQPNRPLQPDERVFFSLLPQALSTEAEMMTQYPLNLVSESEEITCIQRIHVTGGTNGILESSLRRHRPFTPSFIGRAEDQAYLLSVMEAARFPTEADTAGGHTDKEPCPRLAYVHEPGLIMRHDKEAFAQDAMKAAKVSKLIGDYIRIINFSAYAQSLGDVSGIKAETDPFTGCFISVIPKTVVYLRFALKAATFFEEGTDSDGLEFVRDGATRLHKAFQFAEGPDSALQQTYLQERQGWNLYYDVLNALETALRDQDPFALKLQATAQHVVEECLINNV